MVKESGRNRKLQFFDRIRTNDCRFSTKEIMVAQNCKFCSLIFFKLNFTSKFCISGQKFFVKIKIFPTIFSRPKKISVDNNCSCHDATDDGLCCYASRYKSTIRSSSRVSSLQASTSTPVRPGKSTTSPSGN